MRVRCKIPNAVSPIGGVVFSPDPAGGLVSDPIDTDTAARFLRIRGYEAVPELDLPEPEPVPDLTRAKRPRGRDDVAA